MDVLASLVLDLVLVEYADETDELDLKEIAIELVVFELVVFELVVFELVVE
ncbi:hypothetical protein M1146_00110 [Patescibacteria group bacterium]|nr:hypothetical protein [Patescibacteria group bacterium]